MLEQQQERKISGPKRPDGAKLSFQEKMKLFAQEVTLNKANCDDPNINSQYSRLVRLHQETKLKSPRLRERLTLQVDFPEEEDLPVKLQRKWLLLTTLLHDVVATFTLHLYYVEFFILIDIFAFTLLILVTNMHLHNSYSYRSRVTKTFYLCT